jgi:YD repeat-containing protein
VYKFKKVGLAAPLGEYSTLTRNDDGTYTRRLLNGITIIFNSDGYQTSWTDRNDNTTDYTYDSGGKLKTITDPTGKTTTFNYNNGRLQSITDPVGRTTTFQHDADGNLTSIKDPDNSNTTYTYNTRHMLTSKKVPTGETYSYEYDEYDRIVKSTAPTGEVRQYEPGRMAAIVNKLPAGVGTETNPAVIKDIKGLVNTYTDDQGNKTTNRINMRGFTLEDKDALGHTTSFERDRDGNITRITRPNGEIEIMTYDDNGNLLTHTSSSTGGTITFTYEPVFNKITSITDPNGNTSTMEYDSKGNLTKTTDPLGNQTAMTYDSRGLLTSTTDALGKTSTFDYDGAGNLTTFTDPLGKTTFFEYDEAGNRTSMTDANGKTTLFQYDIANNLIEIKSADGSITSFAYSSGEHCSSCGATNGGDLLTSLTDANDNTTAFSYNEIGQLNQTTNPAGLVNSYIYDTDRKLISKTDPNLQTITYQYDKAGQLIQKDLPDDQVRYYYDYMGNINAVIDSDSRVTMLYDGQSRLIQSEPEFGSSLQKTINQDTTIEAWNMLYDFRDLIVDGALVTIKGAHTFTTLAIINGGTVTHAEATSTTSSSTTLNITNTLTIDSTSSIDVSDKGYLGGRRGDNYSSSSGRTVGNTTTGGSMYGSGGSYGGRGGQYSNYDVNEVYGSLYDPNELGSGGGGNDSLRKGGNGGGLVRITAAAIVLNGSIKANGGDGSDNSTNGGGSGGGVYIGTGALSGTGTIAANGGKNSMDYSGTTGGRRRPYSRIL